MAAVLMCDVCDLEIHDGIETVSKFLKLPDSTEKKTTDYCSACMSNGIIATIEEPKFISMLVTKIGVHIE